MKNENKDIIQLPCEVVKDLLPLYADGLVSEKTAGAVVVHLEDCADCKREYELIKTHLPVEEKRCTAMKFADMMNRLRIRRILAYMIVAALTCAVLASGFWGLTQVPVRHVDPSCISIERSHLYEDEGGTELFIWYKDIMWNSPTFKNMHIEETDDPGIWELKCDYKTAIISKPFSDEDTVDGVWGLPVEADIDDVKKIIFAGQTIWEAKDNQTVPEYVTAYRDFNSMGGRFDGMTIDADKNFIGFDDTQNQYYIYWDLDGNLLYEGDGTDADKVIDFDVPDNPPVTDE